MAVITEEFYNKYHSKKDGKFVSGGHAVTGPAQPLRNSTTGRINPTAVRQAYKQSDQKTMYGRKAPATNSRTRVGVTGDPAKDSTRTTKTYAGRDVSSPHYGGHGTRTRNFVDHFKRLNALQREKDRGRSPLTLARPKPSSAGVKKNFNINVTKAQHAEYQKLRLREPVVDRYKLARERVAVRKKKA